MTETLADLYALRERVTARIRAIERREGMRQTPADSSRGLIAACAERNGVTVEDLLSSSRAAASVRARQEAAWELRQRDLSYPQIGRLLGRDHTTIMFAVKKIDGERLRPRLIRGGAA